MSAAPRLRPSARHLPGAVQWHEGMLLAPQHFQQSALRLEELVQFHASALAPFHWGVWHLAIDLKALPQGTFRVDELEAVLPDGLVVTHPAEGAGELAIDLEDRLAELAERPITIQLAVPARRAGDSPVLGELARFESVEGRPVADENTGEGELAIPRLRPRLRLLAEDALPGKYAGFPLARLTLRNEAVALADYAPPLLRVEAGSALASLCGAIAHRLRERAALLSDRVRNPSVATRAPLLLETKLQIQSLTAALPAFEALLAAEAHPFALYLALCSLVGGAAMLGRDAVPPQLPAYDHDDLHARFARARDFLWKVVAEGIVESFTGFPFYLEEGVFSLAFDAVWRDRALALGVRCPAGVPERDVVAWVERCLIGSQDRIADMRHRRVLGPARRRTEGEGDLVPSSGTVLFKLDYDPEFVEPNQLLQIVAVGESELRRPVEIVLYVRNRA